MGDTDMNFQLVYVCVCERAQFFHFFCHLILFIHSLLFLVCFNFARFDIASKQT